MKVLDFGVSKIKAARTKLTRATAVIGTPEYMSPEQATGLIEEIDHRADQWALGCIVWEMLSGHAPFIADDMGALFYQVINMDPHPLARRAPGLPAGVEPVLRRALAKRAHERYPSIKDFARAFEAAATGRQRELTPAPVDLLPPVAKGTIAYGEVVTPPPGDWEAETAAAPPPGRVAEGRVRTSRDALADGLDELPVRKIKPIYLAAAGVAVLLIVLVSVLWTRKTPPAPLAPVAKPPAAVAPVVKERHGRRLAWRWGGVAMSRCLTDGTIWRRFDA